MAKRLYVALKRPRTYRQQLSYASHIATFMTGNPYFSSPTLPISTLLAHIADADAAATVAGTKLQGAVPARNAKVQIVLQDLIHLRTYIQTIANQHAEDAAAVVASSGMSVKRTAGPKKQNLAAKQGKVSGSVRLIARHPGVRSSFDWQYSTDGVHWVDGARTATASADITGLTPGILHYFRLRTLTSQGLSDWSDPVTLRVL